MKRFLMICGCIAGGCLLLGGILLGGLTLAGGRGVIDDAFQATKGQKVDLSDLEQEMAGLSKYFDKLFKTTEKNIVEIETGDELRDGNVQRTELQSGYKKMKLTIGACTFTVKHSNDKTFYLEAKNMGKLSIDQDGSTLEIATEEDLDIEDFQEKRELVLYVPEKVSFDEVELKFGAGEVVFDSLSTEKFKAEIGAGHILVNNGEVEKVELSVGAGAVEYYGNIQEKMEADCSMGSIYAELQGKEEEFDYDLECSMGNIAINGQDYASDRKVDNHAQKKMKLSCAMGSVEVLFSERNTL